jgi:hypothetical protein
MSCGSRCIEGLEPEHVIVLREQWPDEHLLWRVPAIRAKDDDIPLDIDIGGGPVHLFPRVLAPGLAAHEDGAVLAVLDEVNRPLRLLLGEARLEPWVAEQGRVYAGRDDPRERRDKRGRLGGAAERLLELGSELHRAAVEGEPLGHGAHRQLLRQHDRRFGQILLESVAKPRDGRALLA